MEQLRCVRLGALIGNGANRVAMTMPLIAHVATSILKIRNLKLEN